MFLNNNGDLEIKINKLIVSFMFLYVFGAPYSISVAQLGLVPAITLWLVKIIFIKKGKFYGSFIDIGLAVYLLGELITSIFCEYPKSAFSGYQGEWQILTIWLMLDVIDKEKLRKLIDVLFVMSVITAIYGVYQYFSGWDLIRHKRLNPNAWINGSITYDITGGFGMHLTYGGFFMMIALLGIALIFISYKKDMKKFWLYLGGTTIIVFTVYGAYARSVWVGFVAGLLTFGFLKNKRLFVVIAIVLILLGVIMFYTVPQFHYKISTFENLTKLPRWQIWSVAVRILKDHPIIGVGNGNFIKYYDKYKEQGWFHKMSHPHNDFLNIYLTSGILGFIGYMSIWILLFVYSYRFIKHTNELIDKHLMIALISGVIAFLFAGLSQNYFTDSENSMLLWFFIGSIFVLYYNKKQKVFFPASLKSFKENEK